MVSTIIAAIYTLTRPTSVNYLLQPHARYMWLGFEKTRLFHELNSKTHFHHHMIMPACSYRYWLTFQTGSYQCWNLYRLLLPWLVSEACQTSTNAGMVSTEFKWLHMSGHLASVPWTSRQLIINHYTTGCVTRLTWIWLLSGNLGWNSTNWCPPVGCLISVYMEVMTLHFMASSDPQPALLLLIASWMIATRKLMAWEQPCSTLSQLK